MDFGNNNTEFSQAVVLVRSSTTALKVTRQKELCNTRVEQEAQIQFNCIYMSPIHIQSCPRIEMVFMTKNADAEQ